MNELIESGDLRAKVFGRRRPPAAGSEALKAAAQLNLLASQLRNRPFLGPARSLSLQIPRRSRCMDDEPLYPIEETRPPSDLDLARLAAKLNELGAKYIVVGGFAVITAEFRDHLGVSIPFASPALLWKTKQTYRDKDAVGRAFLRRLLEERGEWPVA